MDQILRIAEIVLPLFGMIAFGYGAAWSGLLRERTAEGLSDYVYTIAIPLLIFRTLTEATLPDALPWAYWLAYFAGAAAAWAIGQAISAWLFGRGTREAIIHGFSAGQSNVALVGIPLVLSAFGEPGALPLFLLIAVNLPLMMTTASILIESSGSGFSRQTLLSLARNLATNFILIGFAAGLAAQLVGLKLGGAPKAIVDLVAASAVPCALFAMGLALRRYGVTGDLGVTGVLVALKLMVHPFIVFLLAHYVLALPPIWAGVAVTFAAMPCGINSYLLAERYRAGVAAAAGAVSISTALAVLSISFWLWMLGVGAR